MNPLLQWSIAAAGSGNGSSEGNGDMERPRVDPAELRPGGRLDPAIIDLILGKSDAVLMQELLSIALMLEKHLDDRVAAMEEFEMLIENLDNASNLEKLKMWPSILELCGSPMEPIRFHALWICGTAVQNNATAQDHLLSHEPCKIFLSAVAADSHNSAETRAKGMYAISNLLRHFPAAVHAFTELGGWSVLKACLSDDEPIIRSKTVYLLNSLLMQDSPATDESVKERTRHLHLSDVKSARHVLMTDGLALRAMHQHDIPSTIVESLSPILSSCDDIDDKYMENALRFLLMYIDGFPKDASIDSRAKELLESVRRRPGCTGLSDDELARLAKTVCQ